MGECTREREKWVALAASTGLVLVHGAWIRQIVRAGVCEVDVLSTKLLIAARAIREISSRRQPPQAFLAWGRCRRRWAGYTLAPWRSSTFILAHAQRLVEDQPVHLRLATRHCAGRVQVRGRGARRHRWRWIRPLVFGATWVWRLTMSASSKTNQSTSASPHACPAVRAYSRDRTNAIRSPRDPPESPPRTPSSRPAPPRQLAEATAGRGVGEALVSL